MFPNVFPLFEITGFGLSKSSGMFHAEEKNAMDFMFSSYFYRNFPEKFSTPMNRFIKGIRDKYPGNTNYVLY